MMHTIAERLHIQAAATLEEIIDMEHIILAVPDREVIRCIKMFNQIEKPLLVINIATNVSQSMLQKVIAPHIKCICVKFVGHADEMALGHKPVIIVNQHPAEFVAQMVALFEVVGQVIVGQADVVHQINTMTGQKALEAAIGIEETLKLQHITDPVIVKSAISQVAAGMMKAYAYDNMGPFAQDIVRSIKSRVKKNNM